MSRVKDLFEEGAHFYNDIHVGDTPYHNAHAVIVDLLPKKEAIIKMIPYEFFKKLDMKIGKVLSATRVEGTDKLIRLEVDIGSDKRQIVAGMAEFRDPEDLVGKQVPILVNLEPRKFRGIESHGMILAADVDGRPILLHPEVEVPPGSTIR